MIKWMISTIIIIKNKIIGIIEIDQGLKVH
jgi:hypothetical protein